MKPIDCNFELWCPLEHMFLHLSGNCRMRFGHDMAATKTRTNALFIQILTRFAHIVYRWKGINEGFPSELTMEERWYIYMLN